MGTGLLSGVGKGLRPRGEDEGAGEEGDGAARPLPLPSTRPPPSLRPDMMTTTADVNGAV